MVSILDYLLYMKRRAVNLFDIESATPSAVNGTVTQLPTGYNIKVTRLGSNTRLRILIPSNVFKAGHNYKLIFDTNIPAINNVTIGEASNAEDTTTYTKYKQGKAGEAAGIKFKVNEITKQYLVMFFYYANAEVDAEFYVKDIKIINA